MKKPLVNQTICIGCGTCSTLCPNTFSLKENGKALVTNPQGEPKDKIQENVDLCPVEAISWENY